MQASNQPPRFVADRPPRVAGSPVLNALGTALGLVAAARVRVRGSAARVGVRVLAAAARVGGRVLAAAARVGGRVLAAAARVGVRVLAALLGVVFCAGGALAQGCGNEWLPGPSREIPGVDGTVYATLEWDPDGDGPEPPLLVVGGKFSQAGGTEVNGIARWDPDAGGGAGEWQPFGSGMNDWVETLTTWDPDGAGPLPAQLVAGGWFGQAGGTAASGIARWDPDANGGAGAWLPFGSGMNSTVRALTIWDPDGDGPQPAQLVAGGSFSQAGGEAASRIARWDPAANGGAGAWLPFGSGMIALVRALTLWDSDGDGPLPAQLVAGGDFTHAGGTRVNFIARWDPAANGGVGAWLPFGTGMSARVFALTLWDPDGCGPEPAQLVAGGLFTHAGGIQVNHIARWDPSAGGGAGAWLPFGSGVSGGSFPRIYALTSWDQDGSGPLPAQLVAGGLFTHAGETGANNIVRWDPSAGGGAGAWLPFGSGINDLVWALSLWDPDGSGPLPTQLVPGGNFTQAGGTQVNHIARWDPAAGGGAGEWRSFGSGMNSVVYDLTLWDPDGDGPQPAQLVAGGEFTQAGGTQVNYIARWDPAANGGAGAWLPFGSGMNSWVSALTTWDPDGAGPLPAQLVAGGGFTHAGGTQVNHIARWDPEAGGGAGAWRSFGSGMGGDYPVVYALTTWDSDGNGPQPVQLVAGGSFIKAGGTQVNFIARWDPDAGGGAGAWLPFGSEISSTVIALTTWDPDGAGPLPAQAVAGGWFTQAGGTTVNYIARWDPEAGGGAGAWHPFGAGMSGSVYAVTTWDPDGDGPQPAQLVAGGGFTHAGGTQVNRIARWDPDANGGAGAWLPFGSGMSEGSLPAIYALSTWDPDGAGPQPAQLVAGGSFIKAGGTVVNRIARWDPAANSGAGAWLPFGSGVSGWLFSTVSALTIWDPDGTSGPARPRLLVGGDFTHAGGRVSPYIAEFGRASATWSNPSGGQFAAASNWQCGLPPSRFDRLFFDATAAGYAPGAYSVLLPDGDPSDPVRAVALRARTDIVQINLRNRPLLLDAGTVQDPSLVVGEHPAHSVTLSVRNSVPGTVVVAPFDAGTVVIGAAANPSLHTSRLRVEDQWVSFTASGSVYVGRAGNKGELEVQAGASAAVDGLISIGTLPGAKGEVRIVNSGSVLLHSLEGRSMGIGDRGEGSLRIGGPGSQAGAMAASIGRMNTLSVGLFPTSGVEHAGTVEVRGAGSIWSVETRRIFFGYAGGARVLVRDRGQLETDTLDEVWIGRFPGKRSVVEVRDAGSRWRETGASVRIGRDGKLIVRAGASAEALAFIVETGGRISGDGSIGSLGGGASGERLLTDVVNLGEVSPESEAGGPAVLTVQGNYAQLGQSAGGVEDSGRLKIRLFGSPGGTVSDTLEIGFGAQLSGGLVVVRDPSFTGEAGPVELLRADGGVTGFFDVAFLPPAGAAGKYLRAGLVADALRGVAVGVTLTVEDLGDPIGVQPGAVGLFAGTPASAAAGDFDGDGLLDIAVVVPRFDGSDQPIDGDLVVLLNQGLDTNGDWIGWSVVQYTGAVGRGPSGIAAAEIDGEPGLDLAVSEAGDHTVSVLRGLGGGLFQPRVTFSVGMEPRAVAAADLDGDGFADIVTANASSGTLSLLRNQGAPGGSWLGLGQSLGDQRVDIVSDPTSLTPRPVSVALANLNGEAGLEVIVANEGSSAVTVFRNGDGLRSSWSARWNFPPIRVPTVNPPTTIRPGTVDDDKWEDMAFTSAQGGAVGIILNSRAMGDAPETLRFRPAVEAPVGGEAGSFVLVDLDGDGDLDIAVVALDEQQERVVRVLRNDSPAQGTVTLSPDQDITASVAPALVLAANIDGDADGRQDLIVLGAGVPGGALLGLRGEETGGVQAMLSRASAPPPPPPCPGDANNDGEVNFADITSVLNNWLADYTPGTGPGDANHDGVVNFIDVTSVLNNWLGECG